MVSLKRSLLLREHPRTDSDQVIVKQGVLLKPIDSLVYQ